MDICPFCQSFLHNKARCLAETAKSAILHPKKQASTKQDKQPNDDVNDQSDEIETDNIAEIPNVEREIKFINERIESLPAVNPPALVTSSFSTATSPTPGQAMTTPHTTGQIPLIEW